MSKGQPKLQLDDPRPKRPQPAGRRNTGAGKRLLRWLLVLSLLGLLFGGGGAVGIFYYYASDPELPKLDRVSEHQFKVVTQILAVDGELVGELYEERRTVIPKEKIPDLVKQAFVDAEDAGFYEHKGLSYVGMLRALLNNLRPGAHMQGASTITQQLVRNLILKTNARTLRRKVQEIILSRRIEDKLTKDEILFLYLNLIEFGHRRFGVDEAAKFYFGKSVTEVDAGEAALLASLPKGPTEIDPWKNPDRAKDRQRYVLSQLARYNHISKEAAEKFAASPIRIVRNPAPSVGTAPEFVTEAKKVIEERFGAARLPTLGIKIKTTCDARIQKLARDALEKGLQNLDERQGYRKPLQRLPKQEQRDAYIKKLVKQYPKVPSMDKIVDGVITELVSKGEARALGARVSLGVVEGWLPLPASADRYNPKALTPDKRFAVGDVIRVRILEQPADKPPILGLELGPQAAVVVLDPHTREVKAMVGGYGYTVGSFNRALSAKRQPGSAFKPIVYTAAFATTHFTPATVLVDGPQVYAAPGLAPWKPQNAEKEEYLGPVRLRTALAKSLNTIASQLVDVERGGVDPNEVVRLAHDLGIESQLAPNPSLALGTSEVALMELVNAYATFAAGGKAGKPQFIKAIGGEEQKPAAADFTEAIRPELAFLITSVMTSVIEEGTAQSAKGKLGRPAAGKTGTTNSHKDAWFVGFTPDLVVGVWVGYDDMRELGRGEQGARAALPIWTETMVGALDKAPSKSFAVPPGVIVQRIDPKSGLLPHSGTGGIEEYFLDGTQPSQTAPAPGEGNPDNYLVDP